MPSSYFDRKTILKLTNAFLKATPNSVDYEIQKQAMATFLSHINSKEITFKEALNIISTPEKVGACIRREKAYQIMRMEKISEVLRNKDLQEIKLSLGKHDKESRKALSRLVKKAAIRIVLPVGIAAGLIANYAPPYIDKAFKAAAELFGKPQVPEEIKPEKIRLPIPSRTNPITSSTERASIRTHQNT